MAQISASINKDLLKQIKELHEKGKGSFSQFVEDLLNDAVDSRKGGYMADLIKDEDGKVSFKRNSKGSWWITKYDTN